MTCWNNGTGMRVYTSPNRTTWTLRTTPAQFPTGTAFMQNALVINKATGRIVWLASTVGGGLYWATSDDGGVTWTYRGVLAHTGGVNKLVLYSETCDPETGAFFVILDSSDNPPTKILKSVDGTSWATLASFASYTTTVASLDQLLITSIGGFIACSADGGATWRHTNQRIGDSFTGRVFVGDGCFAASDKTNVYTSLRFGMPSGPTVPLLP